MDDHANITFLSLSPYLRYPDADAAVDWLVRVLGFGPAQAARDESGSWYEGSIAVGPARVSIGGGASMPSGGHLIIGIPDADAMFERIRSAGIEVDEPEDKPYGPRVVTVTDPWGISWSFWEGEARI